MYKFTRDHLKNKKGDQFKPESKERENYFKRMGLIVETPEEPETTETKANGNIPENTDKPKGSRGKGGKRGGRKKGTGN